MSKQDARLGMRLNAETIRQLDDLRRAEDDLPSQAEMIRRLIARAAEQLPANDPMSVRNVLGGKRAASKR